MSRVADRSGVQPGIAVTSGLRWFFLIVAGFTLYVTFWGLLFPKGLPATLPGFAKNFDDALPFNLAIPPLHARFLGAFYGSATLLLWLGRRARPWGEVWLSVWMILLWTGLLGIISFMHLDVFDWQRPPVWAWFFAYLCFPVIAAWWLWRQRGESDAADAEMPSVLHTANEFGTAGAQRIAPVGDAGIHPRLRLAFWVLGLVLTPLAALLFALPGTISPYWPWKLPPVLARIYGGPFLAYGVACLFAARARSWSVVRDFVYAMVAFAVGTLAASTLHRDLFNFAGPAAWVWFGGFVFAGVMAYLYGVRVAGRAA